MRKLLIADDERAVRALVKMTLKNDSYEILEASNGDEALQLAREHRPDLILLDVSMPGISGFDVCRTLKEDPETATIPCIILSARSQDSDRIQGELAGAHEYLTKPFSPLSLMRKVDEALAGSDLA